MDGRDGRREMRGAAVGQIVAVDRGDDDMLEAELGDGVGDLGGFVPRPAPPAGPVRTLQKAQARTCRP